MLLYCASDMHFAKTAAKAWSERPDDDELHRVLQTAMIVMYARPFTRSDFFDFKKAGLDYRPTEQQPAELHDRLLDMRDHAIAHTDAPAKSGRTVSPGVLHTNAGPVYGIDEAYSVISRDSLPALLGLSSHRRFGSRPTRSRSGVSSHRKPT
jgi:hypothetical protein